MTEPTQPWSTRVLDGRYRLGERLGGGAAAEVFRALDERLQRPVAIKIFRGDAAAQLQRHEAEMRTLASLDHPSLVGVYDAGSDDDAGAPFLSCSWSRAARSPTSFVRAPSPWIGRRRTAPLSPMHSPTFTNAASCTATSSPPTFSSHRTAACIWPTSASRDSSTPRTRPAPATCSAPPATS